MLPRIKSIQPIKFLTSAVEAIVSSLTVLSDQGVFTSDSIGDAEEGADDGAAVKMMKSVNQFVETIGKATEWIGDGDAVRFSSHAFSVRWLCLYRCRSLAVLTATSVSAAHDSRIITSRARLSSG